MLLVWRMEEGATNQRMELSKLGKAGRLILSLSVPLVGAWPCQYLDFNPVKLIDLRLPELKE